MLERRRLPNLGVPANLYDDNWRYVNRQPDRNSPQDFKWNDPKKIPVCPHYSLIEICAGLVGTRPDELSQKDQFCGLVGTHEDSIGALSGFRGTNFEPRTTCSEIHDGLEKRLAFMRSEMVSNAQEVEEMLNASIDIRKKKVALDKEVKALETQATQDQIFLTWQEIIYNTCCVPAQEGDQRTKLLLPEPNLTSEQKMKLAQPAIEMKDYHFRRLNSPNDLSFNEVLSRVESFLVALRNQVTGDSNISTFYLGRYSKGALYCPQAPERFQIGMHS